MILELEEDGIQNVNSQEKSTHFQKFNSVLDEV